MPLMEPCELLKNEIKIFLENLILIMFFGKKINERCINYLIDANVCMLMENVMLYNFSSLRGIKKSALFEIFADNLHLCRPFWIMTSIRDMRQKFKIRLFCLENGFSANNKLSV